MAKATTLLEVIERLIKAGYPEGTAKKIASGELPMDEASRLGRAIEQRKAIDKPLIHRTDVPDILEFMPSKRGRMGAGVYTTPREEYGQGFGNLRYDLVAEQVPATFEQRLQIVQDISKQMMAEGVDPRIAINTAQNRANEILKSQGYTTVEMAQKHGGQKMLDEVLVLDPANLRDLRRAAFDPDNIGKPNILGSAAPVAAGGILAALGGNDAQASEYRPTDKSVADLAQRTIRQSYDPLPSVGSIEGVPNNLVSQGANTAAFKMDRLNRNLQNAGILSLLAPESTPDVLGRAAYGESRWYDPALVLLDFL